MEAAKWSVDIENSQQIRDVVVFLTQVPQAAGQRRRERPLTPCGARQLGCCGCAGAVQASSTRWRTCKGHALLLPPASARQRPLTLSVRAFSSCASAYVYACARACVRACVRACARARVRACGRAGFCVHVFVHVFVRVCVLVRARARTRWRQPLSVPGVGMSCYITGPPFEQWHFIGAITNESPSGVFRVRWPKVLVSV